MHSVKKDNLLLRLLPSPFPDTVPDITESELRETAYEILVAACRSSELKPLTFNRTKESSSSNGGKGQRSTSLHRSVSYVAESKVKKEMGLKRSVSEVGEEEVGVGKKSFGAGTMGELMRLQMGVPEITDTRIRRALLRIAAAKLGKRIESMVLPLELIGQLKCSDFPNQQEYKSWLRRHLKILEAGLLLHPHLPLLDHKEGSSAQCLHQIIHGSLENPMDIRNNIESMQNLYDVVMSLACRTNESVNETCRCHWADGVPLNLVIYQTLLEACFDNIEVTMVIEEVDEVLELIKKTWIVLGMNEMLHNMCFSWVLFHRYVVTGNVENDLLFASGNLLAKVEKDAEAAKNIFNSKSLSPMLSLMLSWAEKRLCAYHGNFHKGNIESMQSIVSFAISTATILVQDESLEHNRMTEEANESRTRIENYIKSSLRHVFTKKLEKLHHSKHASKKQNKAFLSLAALAQCTSELALYEKDIFSPILKRWHPLASGVAAATLHACYGNEFKQYVKRIKQLTPDAVEMLLAADKLEKELVHIAAEDSFESEDGGKSIIREMHPYEVEVVIANLVRSWIKSRVDRVEEWIDKSLQREAWNPRENDGIAPSAVEVLRAIDDSLEAFFQLPIPNHAVLLPRLVSDLDNSLQQYILKARTGCGHRDSFIPTVPALTRCSTESKLQSLFRKKEKSSLPQRKKSQVGNENIDNSFGLPQLCVRINTMKHIQRELKVLENRTNFYLGTSESSNENDTKADFKFKLSALASTGGINHLSEVIAYKVIFNDLSHVLWDGLYIGEVSSTRIEPFLEELEQCLNIISSTVHDDIAKTQVLTEVMEACFEGFLLVLLAGGPSRAFSPEDYFIMKEDFKFLTELFRSNGYGVPVELIEKCTANVEGVLPLFGMSTESLIQQFSQLSMGMSGSSAKSSFPLPQTSTKFRPREPNTLLHVLAHRNDERATKYLKKNCNLPKKH